MKDTYDKFYDAIGYIILIGLLVAYFFLQASILEMPVLEMLQDFRSIIHLLFTITANVFTVSVAYDKGLDKGLDSIAFQEADKTNNEIIQYVNSNYEKTLDYIVHLNELEKNNAVREFLFSKDKRSIDELNKRELRQLRRLKPKRYTTKGLTASLYYEKVRGNVHNFDASFSQSSKTLSLISKVTFGLLSGLMTVQIGFVWQNVGQALISTLLLSGIMSANYLFNYNKPILQLTKRIPKKVDNKKTFYESLKTFKGVKLDDDEKEKVKEVRKPINDSLNVEPLLMQLKDIRDYDLDDEEIKKIKAIKNPFDDKEE